MRLPLLGKIDSDHLVLLVLLAASLGLNLLWAPVRTTHPVTYPGSLSEGDSLEGMPVTTITGDVHAIAFGQDGRPTVVYFFKPSCSWCEANVGSLASLRHQIGARLRFVAISLESKGLQDYASRHQIKESELWVLPEGGVSKKIPVVPHTIVVSPTGRVVKAWSGSYSGRLKEEVEDYFRVVLPAAPTPAPGFADVKS